MGRRWWPEALTGALACMVFLGSLGSPELWGKREQRAAAEALDTVENGRWLVAEIQGRPRLEKPPLPRWAAATLMHLTGRRDEWVVRLPCALSGLATVSLIYALGRRLGGRGLGLASAMILSTAALFVTELRQAGNDGPLCFFTTLALYAAWCWLHGTRGGNRAAIVQAANPPNSRRWAITFHMALGLGFLCKGPIILVLVGLAVIPSLLTGNRLRRGLSLLADPWGLLLLLAWSLTWPVLVVLSDPHALGVWMTEMGQKTGILPIGHQQREGLGLSLPLLALPWPVAALVGVALPAVSKRRISVPWRPEAMCFVWSWSIGNLAMFSLWAVAKPNYYVPCLPGLAVLSAMAWIRLCRVARGRVSSASSVLARALLLLQGLCLLVCGTLAPFLSRNYLSSSPGAWLAILAVLASSGVALGLWIWRRGSNVLSLAPIMAAFAIGVLIGYGIIAPVDNPARGHRQLARQLERLIPPNASTVRFFHEIDEGLWFYLRGHRLVPVPGSQPRYSDSYDKLDRLMSDGPAPVVSADSPDRSRDQMQSLLDWVGGRGRAEPYLMIRSTVYERLSPGLAGRVRPLYRDTGLGRNGLTLLRVEASGFPMARRGLADAQPTRR
jgi:4-amino-4-deoxy-L-arabinose transferase-like glycosyltransferase